MYSSTWCPPVTSQPRHHSNTAIALVRSRTVLKLSAYFSVSNKRARAAGDLTDRRGILSSNIYSSSFGTRGAAAAGRGRLPTGVLSLRLVFGAIPFVARVACRRGLLEAD